MSLLSGCLEATTGQMKNRIACDPSFTEMWSVSKYGPFGLTSDITKEDAETACQAILLYNMAKKINEATKAK
jgi:hypothetical protein